MDDVQGDRQIVGNKVSRISVVCINPTDMTSRENDGIGSRLLQPTLGVRLPRQIETLTVHREDFTLLVGEPADNCRTCHAFMAGDKNAFAA